MDIETARKVARLARIEMDDAELAKIAPQLSSILEWIEQLDEVDTSSVEPLANVVNIPLRLREDVVNDGNCRDKVLSNAPEEMQGFYVVPKVIGEGE